MGRTGQASELAGLAEEQAYMLLDKKDWLEDEWNRL